MIALNYGLSLAVMIVVGIVCVGGVVMLRKRLAWQDVLMTAVLFAFVGSNVRSALYSLAVGALGAQGSAIVGALVAMLANTLATFLVLFVLFRFAHRKAPTSREAIGIFVAATMFQLLSTVMANALTYERVFSALRDSDLAERFSSLTTSQLASMEAYYESMTPLPIVLLMVQVPVVVVGMAGAVVLFYHAFHVHDNRYLLGAFAWLLVTDAVVAPLQAVHPLLSLAGMVCVLALAGWIVATKRDGAFAEYLSEVRNLG